MTLPELHFHFLNSKGVCTDTRSLQEGQLFFALKGDNFNGNTYASQAVSSGALLAIIDDQSLKTEHTVVVDNVLKTLQDLATYHRQYLNVPIIALTGSNGKTTTKELINAVLSEKFKTTATQGNLNNHIGVPLTLLSMTDETELGIVEMGANHQGEIAMLCKIAQPNYGYITNFGKAHLEGFGGINGVIKGKSELYDFLKANDEVAFINNDDAIQVEKTSKMSVVTFGTSQADFPVTFNKTTDSLTIKVDQTTIDSNLTGAYNFSNIAAAITMGRYFNLTLEEIKTGVEKYFPENNRSQIIKKGKYQVILDAYNANPTSMTAALENLHVHKGSKIAFLGDMFEVGKTSLQEHQAILDQAHQLDIDKVFAVGMDFSRAQPHPDQEVFETYDAFAKAYSLKIPDDSMVLIKGSRGMKMERVLDLLSD